jgi:hypothetical protein
MTKLKYCDDFLAQCFVAEKEEKCPLFVTFVSPLVVIHDLI